MNVSIRDILAKLKKLPGGTVNKRLSPHFMYGENKSVFRGRGRDFFQIRPYDPEKDSVHQIAWHLSYLDENEDVFVREAIVPKEVPILLVADLSSSMDFGVAGNLCKRRLLLEVMGILGLTACHDQNRVAFAGFTDKVLFNVPLRSGDANVYYLIKRVYNFLNHADPKDRRQTDFNVVLDFILKRYRRRMLVIFLSDFVQFREKTSLSLLKSARNSHELIFLFLRDDGEFVLSHRRGFLRKENMETGSRATISIKRLRKFWDEVKKDQVKLVEELTRLGIDSLPLEYGNHFEELGKFFVKRRAGK